MNSPELEFWRWKTLKPTRLTLQSPQDTNSSQWTSRNRNCYVTEFDLRIYEQNYLEHFDFFLNFFEQILLSSWNMLTFVFIEEVFLVKFFTAHWTSPQWAKVTFKFLTLRSHFRSFFFLFIPFSPVFPKSVVQWKVNLLKHNFSLIKFQHDNMY